MPLIALPTTSDPVGAISGLLTASEFVANAMKKLGVLSSGEAPTGQETEDGLSELNWMLKSFAARGLNLWRETEGSMTFPAGTATKTMTPFCLDVVEARLVQSSTFERPLQRWENGQYRQIPNKAQMGYPTAYYLNKQVASISMTLWPVPSTDSTVLYTYARVTEDVTDGAQTIDVPQEWTEAVELALAARLIPHFGVARLSPDTAQDVRQRAAALEQLLFDQDRAASYFLGSSYGRNF